MIRSLSKKLLPEILQKPLKELSGYLSLRKEKNGKCGELESFLWEAQWWEREDRSLAVEKAPENSAPSLRKGSWVWLALPRSGGEA